MEELSDTGNIQNIVEFWRKYGYMDISKDQLDFIISRHLEYKTLEVIKVDKKIAGVCRYNICGDTCECLDIVIKPEHRKKNILKLMLIQGLRKFPLTTKLTYVRGFKDNNNREVSIMKFLGVRI